MLGTTVGANVICFNEDLIRSAPLLILANCSTLVALLVALTPIRIFPSSVQFIRLHRRMSVTAFISRTLSHHLILSSSHSFLYIIPALFSTLPFLMAPRRLCHRIATNNVFTKTTCRVHKYRLDHYDIHRTGIDQYQCVEPLQGMNPLFACMPSSSMGPLDELSSQQRTHVCVEK